MHLPLIVSTSLDGLTMTFTTNEPLVENGQVVTSAGRCVFRAMLLEYRGAFTSPRFKGNTMELDFISQAPLEFQEHPHGTMKFDNIPVRLHHSSTTLYAGQSASQRSREIHSMEDARQAFEDRSSITLWVTTVTSTALTYLDSTPLNLGDLGSMGALVHPAEDDAPEWVCGRMVLQAPFYPLTQEPLVEAEKLIAEANRRLSR